MSIYRENKKLQQEKNIMICFIIIPLAIALMITICELVKRGSYDAGYQACIEEYNLYLPYE